MSPDKIDLICSKCGLCCQLFLINLNENEYKSGEYLTVFNDFEPFDDFEEAANCGANLLKQELDGSCIYLEDSKCSIHERRPAVCRDFFCKGSEEKFQTMRDIIEKARN